MSQDVRFWTPSRIVLTVSVPWGDFTHTGIIAR